MKNCRQLVAAAPMVAIALGLSAPSTAQAQDMYVGQIVQVGFTFCPRGTLEANGAILPIANNQALFSLIGAIYGGDGSTTFGLPNLQGRAAIGQGSGPGLSQHPQGQVGGTEQMTLTVAQMPTHNHSPRISLTVAEADSRNPTGNSFARAAQDTYVDNQDPDPAQQFHPGVITSQNVGSNMPFSVMQPFLATRFCIVTDGIYPSRP